MMIYKMIMMVYLFNLIIEHNKDHHNKDLNKQQEIKYNLMIIYLMILNQHKQCQDNNQIIIKDKILEVIKMILIILIMIMMIQNNKL